MIYKEKGFELKGLKLGQEIKDVGVIVAIEDSDDEVLDVAVLTDKVTYEMTIKESSDFEYFGTHYALTGYEDSKNIEWIDSWTLK